MSNNLPTRPNLDHLRKQAKDLLAGLKDRDLEAIREFQSHLPAANGLTEDQIASGAYSLSDAQSVVARKHGFASWDRLARHVEGLRAIEGTWVFTGLSIEGNSLPPGAFSRSHMELYGNSFKMISPEADYAGTFELNIEANPHTVDIHFTEGPEAGNTAEGIYKFDGEELTFCLSLTEGNRPTEFVSKPGSNHALETLVRGEPRGISPRKETTADEPSEVSTEAFEEITPEIERLQGVWKPVSINRHGMPLPSSFLSSGKREMNGTESVVTFGGQLFMKALTRLDTSTTPISLDYLVMQGPNKGVVQQGILQWQGDDIVICFAEPGAPRPDRFEVPQGVAWTLTTWRKA